MVKIGYYFLVGTNIEVSVRKLSSDKKYASVALRVGKNIFMSNLTAKQKKLQARKIKQFVVPSASLCAKSNFTKRGKLRAHIVGFSVQRTPVDLDSDIFIWGVLKAPFKKYDNKTGVVTFATTPVRKAHVDVLRNSQLDSPVFEKRVSRIGDNTPASGFLQGTNIPLKLLIEDSRISLYGYGRSASWIPNALVGEAQERVVSKGEHLGKVTLHGCVSVDAFNSDGNFIAVRLPGEFCNPKYWADRSFVGEELEWLKEYRTDVKEAFLEQHRKREASIYLTVL